MNEDIEKPMSHGNPMDAIRQVNWMPWPRKPLSKGKSPAKAASPARVSRGGKKKGH